MLLPASQNLVELQTALRVPLRPLGKILEYSLEMHEVPYLNHTLGYTFASINQPSILHNASKYELFEMHQL